MAVIRKYAMSYQPPDIPQILLEAQNRWLRPTEICLILTNYKKFSIAPEPPNRPQSGSLFLFDRKILRYFRKDGHNWRKKKDGKTVKEVHEKLKVGSVDVLHCYYAHGEDNENFQRRSYWMLEEGLMSIVLVHYLEIKAKNDGYTDQSVRYPHLKQSSSDLFKMEPDGLKKFDTFSRWMSNELPEVVDLDIKSSSDAFWSTSETVNVADGSSIPINEQLDAFVVSPSLPQDQIFSIVDVSPRWAYNGTKTKVLITGTFLAKKEDVENFRWSCMFGDAEVSAEVLVDGSLRCYTPLHHSGRVPFYVTCSNRVACSEVREFEFRDSETHYMDTSDQHTTSINEMHLSIRLDKLLSLEPEDYEKYMLSNGNKSELINTINSLMLDNLSNLALPSGEKELSTVRDQNLEKQVKEKLYYWLIHKIHDDGRGLNVLGKEGQGAIHLVAALGYDWAIKPIVAAGVNINFRDICGWTALHWAASCGRERTVGSLIANGAAPGALTDPTQQYPSGRTPADLASENGHKGIAGFLAKSALTSHLSALTLKESQGGNVEEICGLTAAEDFVEPSSSRLACVNSLEESLKDSLGAVRKSTQAATGIFQAFTVESFHRKKVIEYGDDDYGLSDERTLSLVSLRNPKPGHGDLHSAAVRIQNKFRGWKRRKEFMIIRQKIVKIQAHVRGHQVRKNYRKVVWSVGIVEKVILRWRRKRSGLRGFQPEKQLEGPSWQSQPAKAEAEDEYGFLKYGRKQVEGRLERALARVRSMNQYPEVREQYHRLQACVNSLQESQTVPSTPYKDVMAWFAIGKLREKGRLSHTCMQQAGQELLGRDDIREKVMEKILLDSNGVNNCTIICIYGWSGLGKTSLLHVLYNDQQLLDAFDKRIWIQMSEKVDMVMFFRKIIEFSMNEHCSIKNIDILRELVVEEITDKKFLLFLDDADIENQQFWTTVLKVLNTGAKGSVVVMATKSSTVAADRNVATHTYSLNPLSEESNLMLLQQYAAVGTDIQSNPDLVMIANWFIARFGYNLLYLKAIGGLLCHTDAASIEDKVEGSIMPLRLCHDALPVHLKRCLALCSLFPEGYIFDKHHMVLLWISHGCVRPVQGYKLEEVGVKYFNELLCRSFFQCSPVHSDKDDMFVMHELIYNVVSSVSCDKYFKSKDLLSNIPENVLHCSLVSSQFQTVELMHRTEQLKDLQTFLALQPECKPNNISLPTLNLVGLNDFFLKFTSLETLDLSHTETKELPGSIAGLRNLRYLSVNSTNVRALPSGLCSLSNLQTLEAKHCRFLTELPKDMKMLVKLRHLDLTKELGYVDLPHGIGELTELQTLPVFHVSGDSSHCSICELGSLQNLRGCLCLSGLESVKPGSKAQEANLKHKHHLKDLTLQWHNDGIEIEDGDEDAEDVAEQVLESLPPHANLQVLTIRGYEGSRFPAWMQDSSSLPNLVTLTLDSCCNCTELPAIAQLPSLKSLSVRKMYDVQRLSSNTDTHGVAKFPSLELLNLREMYGLEELFLKESQGDCPRLRKVCISRCPDLKRLPRGPSLTELFLHCGGQQVPDISELASLVSLKIDGFHGVKSFGLPAAAKLKKLEIRSCKELVSVDGLSALTTIWRLKIAGCPKLVLPGRN